MKLLALLVLSSCLASCVATRSSTYSRELGSPSLLPSTGSAEAGSFAMSSAPAAQDGIPLTGPGRPGRPDWNRGQPLMHGFFGVSEYETVSREGGGTPSVDGDKGDLDDMPVIGGGAQYKLGGERIDFGLEGIFSFGGRANATAWVAGGGGAAVAVDVDLLIFDLYGGPFVSMFLGNHLRAYFAAGPLMEWADYDQENSLSHESGSGFGYGTYARTGLELVLPSRTMIGMGVRWSDTSVDLGGNLGDLDMDGYQLLFTVSRGI